MHNLPIAKRGSAILLGAIGLLTATHAVRGTEPVRPFLDALCQQQYFDQALSYLESLRSSRLVDDGFRQTIDFELAQVLIQAASDTDDLARQERQLNEAEAKLNEFIRSYAGHERVGAAQLQLANVIAERGRGKNAAAQRADPAERQRLSGEGKKQLLEAQQRFASAHKSLQAEFAKLPKPALIDPGDLKTKQRKLQLQRDIAQAELLSANIDYELARAAEPGSDEQTRSLHAAAGKYGQIFDAYRTLGAGLYAHYWQGRCYQELGDLKRALGCYLDLIDLPGGKGEVRSWQTKSLRQAMEIWVDPRQKKYQEAIKQGERWLDNSPSLAQTDADALAIRYFLAIARQSEASDPGNKQPTRSKQLAKKLVAQVASYPGEYQKPAKVMLVKLGGKAEASAPENFEEAYQAAVEAFDGMRATAVGLKIAEENGDNEALAELQATKQQQVDGTVAAHRVAFSMAHGAQPDQLATLRSNLAYLKWEVGEYYDAAVLGEFLAKKYPEGAMGRQGARIAMEAFAKIYADSKSDDKSFEEAQVRRIAELVMKRWPDQEDAEFAALKLLHFAIIDRQLQQADAYLEKIPKDSVRRGPAELRYGQALWASYLQQSAAPAEQRRPQAELDQSKKRAQEIFEGAIQRMEAAGPSTALAAAILSLTQIYLDVSQPEKAIEWLEKDAVGPLKLVEANSPLVQHEGFAIEAYKAALRAYIAIQPQQLQKAERVMSALEARVEATGDAKTNETLTLIYISLGRELQRQLQELRSSGKQKELQLVSKGFEIFLDRVAKRESGASFSSLNWVAETYYSLGAGFDDGSAKISPEARAYYEKATETYRKILAMIEKQPSLAEGDSLLGIRLRQAVALRRSGEYTAALKLLSDILRENKNNLTAQVQAAETYQAQGESSKEAYVSAIAGGMPDEKGNNLIWGWAKLSKMTMNNDKLASTFHDARLKLAESRFKFGLKHKEKKDRRRHVEGAKQELWITYKLYPQLGGPDYQPQYERMLKRIQSSLDEKEVGLKEFKDRAAESASAEKKVGSSS